ncbi:uncharacterized protein [Rutidosis leptorrhynchoides]|uniref:uncharacterized protein isoform X2 n=1 Tax=Rutidosis leptorrhynchoides TaxID=125765 RepID=UPI003A99F705
MGKRKGRQSQTLNNSISNSNSDGENGELRSSDLEEDKSGFFACYLLTSLCPRYKGHTYIGFTVNPRRRIRQHNGELCSGAFRTKKKRPWEMVLCIHGFPTNTVALQFEWAWQHPVESLAVRQAAVAFKSLGGLANKIKLAYTMLTLPAWNKLNLTVNFFSTKYTKHYAGCPTLPSQMKVHVRPIDDLPCYTEGYKEEDMFKYDNDFGDDVDDEEPEKAGGSCDLEVPNEDVTMPVLVHEDCDDNHEDDEPFYSNYLLDEDDEPVKTGGSCDYNIGEEAICVSDDEKSELSPSTGLNNCNDISRTMEDKNGSVRENKDGVGNKIFVSVGEVEVIDVFTPSPEYRPSTRRKKLDSSVVCPEIIDLTQSPICV